MIRKYYIEKQLFGELIKESKKKHVQLPQTQLVNEIKSVNNEPELQWILKTSNAKYIKHMCNTEQKCTNEELSKHGIESVIYKDDSQNKMEIHDTLKYTSENLLQWTNITSFPIFGSETSENKCIRHKAINLNMKIPSVTKVLRDTIPPNARAALEEWKANMIQKLGLLQFERYCEELLENGKMFHSCVENMLLKKEVEVPQELVLEYNSVKPILYDIQTVKTVERYVQHPNLRYNGFVDCVAKYRDELYLIEWKLSGKRKAEFKSTYDAPLQLAAYIGALNASNDYPFKIDKGLVVIAYRNGKPADVHEVKGQVLQESWSKWLERLQEFYMYHEKQK